MKTLPRSRISLRRGVAIRVDRISADRMKLVYVILADIKIRYKKGRSRISYIGTTKNGISRIAESAASRAEDIFSRHGIREFEVRVVTCTPRKNVKTWFRLERALLLEFKRLFGEVPFCNGTGHNMREGKEFDLFSRSRIKTILDDLS